MLLTTMALVKRKVGKLPSRRADLYRDAVEVLLNWRREVDEPIDHREALPQLQYVAYAMCDRNVQQLREDEIVALLTEMRADYPNVHALTRHSPETFLRLLERRTGILIEAGLIRHEGWLQPLFEFRHLTFQEYLAGLALVSGRFPGYDRAKPVAQRVAPLAGRTATVTIPYSSDEEFAVTESWREALRLCLATCRDDEVDDVLLAILRPLPDEDASVTARPRAVLAALCLTDEPNASSGVVDEALSTLATFVVPEDVYGGPTGLLEATMALARSRWLGPLRHVLAQEFARREASTLRELLFLMARVAEECAQQEAELDDWLRTYVARPAHLDADMIETAITVGALSDRASEAVVGELARAICPFLARDAAVARAAGWALVMLNLERLGDKAWRPALEQTEWLLTRIRTPETDGLAASFAALVIGRERTPDAVGAIARLLDSDIEVARVTAADALRSLGDAQAVPALIERLDDASPEVRRSVASALGSMRDTAATDPLYARLHDQDEHVRAASLEALAEIGDPRTFNAAIAGLEDESDVMRVSATHALGELGDERAIDHLLRELAADSERGTRFAASQALAQIGGGQTVAKLADVLNSPDDEPGSMVTYYAARTLAQIGNERTDHVLISALDHPQESVRANAADALGESRAREILAGELGSVNPSLREAALRGMVRALEDETDRKLLTQDFDGLYPYLDLDRPVDKAWVAAASTALDLEEKEVTRRYESLAPTFGLRLAWHS